MSLLRKPHIRSYIRELQAEAADVARITTGKVARGLDWAAHADRTAIFDERGNMLPVGQWPREVRAIVVGFDVEQEVEYRPDMDAGGELEGFVVRKIKVRFEKSMEAKKTLAQWLKMIGEAKDDSAAKHKPLVVGGEADVESL